MRRAARLAMLPLAVVAIGAAWVLFNVLMLQAIVSLSGASMPLRPVVVRELTSVAIWLLFLPIAIGLAERLPLGRGRWRNLALLTAAVVLLGVLRAMTGGLLEHDFVHEPVSWRDVGVHVALNASVEVYVVVLLVGATNLLRVYRESARRQAQVRAADTQLAWMEMDELRAQLQPGFLFQTLEGIRSVVHASPPAADRLIVNLSDLLRRSLASSARDLSVGESLEQLDRYVSLHAAASGKPTTLHLDVDEQLLPARLPFAVVQPLVEGAVVHAAHGGGGRIRLTASKQSARLHVRVDSDAVAAASSAGVAQGTSLSALRAQMERIFGSNFLLDVRPSARTFTATLDMPFPDPERTDPR